jgi:hypothetical protein
MGLCITELGLFKTPGVFNSYITSSAAEIVKPCSKLASLSKTRRVLNNSPVQNFPLESHTFPNYFANLSGTCVKFGLKLG